MPADSGRFSFGVCAASLMFSVASGACAPDRGTIGATLVQRPDRHLVLRDVPEGLAAARAGLAPGDEILLIDGRDVRELDERAVHATLGGEVDAPVKLTVLRGDKILRVTLRRTPPPKKHGI